jgi:hypothetical protein
VEWRLFLKKCERTVIQSQTKLNLSFIDRLVWNVIVTGCIAGFLVSVGNGIEFCLFSYSWTGIIKGTKVTKLENQTTVY